VPAIAELTAKTLKQKNAKKHLSVFILEFPHENNYDANFEKGGDGVFEINEK
jgi:hypothetical protein